MTCIVNYLVMKFIQNVPKPSPKPRAILEHIKRNGRGDKNGVANVTNDHVNTARARTFFVPKRRTNI